jgi:5-formyltetrahydrofolate cyclo-ligase
MLGKQTMRRQADVDRRLCTAIDLFAVVSDLVAGDVRVASYVGFGNEPFVPPQPGWLLPVLLADADLDWAGYDGQLTHGGRGLLEPVGPRLGVEAIAACDVVFVPALRVDTAGNRLGKGGGSYDRALARATGLTIALLHDGEFVEEVPHEAHDVPVQAVATPSLGLVMLT